MGRVLAIVLGILVLVAGAAYLLAVRSAPPGVDSRVQGPSEAQAAGSLEVEERQSQELGQTETSSGSIAAKPRGRRTIVPTPGGDPQADPEVVQPAQQESPALQAMRERPRGAQQGSPSGSAEESLSRRRDFRRGASPAASGATLSGSASSGTVAGNRRSQRMGSPSPATAGAMVPAGGDVATAAGNSTPGEPAAGDSASGDSASPAVPPDSTSSDSGTGRAPGDGDSEGNPGDDSQETERVPPDSSDRDRDASPQSRDPEEITPAGPARVWLVLATNEVPVGSMVEVQIHIEGAESVSSVPFHLLLNPAVLVYRGAQEGPFLRSDGVGTVFMTAPSVGGERVVVGLSRLGQSAGISGGGLLCSVIFEAIGPGEAALGFDRAQVVSSASSGQGASFEGVSLLVR